MEPPTLLRIPYLTVFNNPYPNSVGILLTPEELSQDALVILIVYNRSSIGRGGGRSERKIK